VRRLLIAVACLAGACSPRGEPGPASVSPSAKNLVIITIDTLRADRVGAYGYGAARTPTIDGLASTGARFTRAYATAPITLTSHASLMTGRYPPGHGARHNGMRLDLATPTLAEMWGERWGREIALVPNGHDLDGPVRQRPERATLTHVGTYYPGKQSFRALWGALQELARSGEAELPRVRFVGELPEEIRQEVGAAGLATVVEATGFIPHADAMRSTASSTVLFASGFAGSDPLSLGVIPAKLFEYLATGLPILYLGNPEDDAAKLLREQPGCFVLEPDDVAGVVAALRVALAAGEYERDVASLSRRARTASLAKVLDAAAGRT